MAIYQGDVLLSKGGTPTALIESNTKSAQKFWRGLKAEYDAIELKDPNTMYIVTDGNASSNEEDNNLKNTLNSHINDFTIHVTPGEKKAWDEKASIAYVDSIITTHNSANDSHNDIRLLVNSIKEKLDNLVDSGENLDQISEVVKLIEDSDSDILQQLTNKVNTADIANNLTTNSATVPLSAAQGVALKALIDNIGNIVGTVSNNLDIINGEVV